MSEPMTSETANVIVVVRMADDIRYLLGRIAVALWLVTGFFVVATCVDLWRHDWYSAAWSAFPAAALGLEGYDAWKRRVKYSAFARSAR